ncbi:MAG: hypothetical protein BWY95_01545 [Bacteroidetes bacterium ADurb.BinA104]|nr:MAG: hypothetical protein BWY95_01545 [Bacteroidetes bacterium ADurb.BinA104]
MLNFPLKTILSSCHNTITVIYRSGREYNLCGIPICTAMPIIFLNCIEIGIHTY